MVGMDYLGVHGGAIAMGGLVVMCLGVVRRQMHASQSSGSMHDDLLFEQVAADMVQTRNSLEHLQTLTDGMQDELSKLSEEVGKLATQQPAAAQPGTGNENALFGLASSLDKLGARLEQRLKKQHDALQHSLDEVTASLEQTRASIEHPAPMPVAMESVAQHTEPADGEIDPQSLGLLDELDDYGTAAPLPQEPPAESGETANRDALDELRVRLERDLGTMQSGGGSWEEELDMVEAPTRSKIEQLAALLADGEVRQALEDLHTRR
jgi:prefoldin subunit 5